MPYAFSLPQGGTPEDELYNIQRCLYSGCITDCEVTSKSAWEGSKLVTKYTRTMGENSIDVVETRYMDGENLVVESVMETPNGERTSKLVFKKG